MTSSVALLILLSKRDLADAHQCCDVQRNEIMMYNETTESRNNVASLLTDHNAENNSMLCRVLSILNV